MLCNKPTVTRQYCMFYHIRSQKREKHDGKKQTIKPFYVRAFVALLRNIKNVNLCPQYMILGQVRPYVTSYIFVPVQVRVLACAYRGVE